MNGLPAEALSKARSDGGSVALFLSPVAYCLLQIACCHEKFFANGDQGEKTLSFLLPGVKWNYCK